mmetsp:Transcript_42899/g.103784  ORF Transcript_42899/g.103784 Transcript_42899/m.103784 type:complete len:101 (+) Transcript_42899:111-413(+)
MVYGSCCLSMFEGRRQSSTSMRFLQELFERSDPNLLLATGRSVGGGATSIVIVGGSIIVGVVVGSVRVGVVVTASTAGVGATRGVVVVSLAVGSGVRHGY